MPKNSLTDSKKANGAALSLAAPSLTKDLVRLLGGAEHCLDRLERADVD